jgi:hypothetical protein
MELFQDTHIVKLELLSNATTINNALQYIKNKQQEQQHSKKHLSLDSTTHDDSSDSQIATGRQTVF